MIIIGIDPGLANTGWGIVETRGSLARARAYGCISTPAKEPLNVRLGTIYRQLTEVVNTYDPTDMAIEKIFFGSNHKSAIATSHSRGAAMVAGSTLGLNVGEYTPMEIKKDVVGNGMADKYQVMYMVRSTLGLDHDPKPDHAADALAAALCHAHTIHTAARMAAANREVC